MDRAFKSRRDCVDVSLVKAFYWNFSAGYTACGRNVLCLQFWWHRGGFEYNKLLVQPTKIFRILNNVLP